MSTALWLLAAAVPYAALRRLVHRWTARAAAATPGRHDLDDYHHLCDALGLDPAAREERT